MSMDEKYEEIWINIDVGDFANIVFDMYLLILKRCILFSGANGNYFPYLYVKDIISGVYLFGFE
jgi:hypothetical protein